MIVVDTNVWSELARPQPDPRVIAWETSNLHLLWLSTIVLAEFRVRAILLPEGRRRETIAAGIEKIVTSYSDRVLLFDDECSKFYGRVLASSRDRGRPIQAPDAMIAATALRHGMRVATRDLNDFAGAGVVLIDPWTA